MLVISGFRPDWGEGDAVLKVLRGKLGRPRVSCWFGSQQSSGSSNSDDDSEIASGEEALWEGQLISFDGQ